MMTAILLSGGTGVRLGSEIPKQYIEVGGKPVISYCITTLSKSKDIDRIVIVADLKWQENIGEWLNESLKETDVKDKFLGFAEPGTNRQLSIYNGLKLIEKELFHERPAGDEDYVFIHDAARPLLTIEDIAAYTSAAPGHDGVLPVLPMKDTVYLSRDGKKVSSLLKREEVFAGQAPEIFQFEKYLKANENLIHWAVSDESGLTAAKGLSNDFGTSAGTEKRISLYSKILKINGSTEPAILAGMDIVMVPGNEGNFKITTAEDLERFRLIVSK